MKNSCLVHPRWHLLHLLLAKVPNTIVWVLVDYLFLHLPHGNSHPSTELVQLMSFPSPPPSDPVNIKAKWYPPIGM